MAKAPAAAPRPEHGPAVVVTGAGRGIGSAIAARLHADGYRLVLNDLVAEPLESVANRLRETGGSVVTVIGDVTQAETNDRLVETCVAAYDRLDVMVANAGIVQVASFDDLDLDKLQRIFEVNVFATVHAIRSSARQMRIQGTGKIITCGSVAGHVGSANMASYCASKAAVISLTQSAARELAPYGITVNAYCPGAVMTDMWSELAERLAAYSSGDGQSSAAAFVDSIPLGRMQTPEDVAGVVSFLAGHDSDYMTGQSVVVDGGIYMH
jgi:meso-butanediol dehydrogenase/(S,S)-butanediol dehydrogenase/diacetyl reductase